MLVCLTINFSSDKLSLKNVVPEKKIYLGFFKKIFS